MSMSLAKCGDDNKNNMMAAQWHAGNEALCLRRIAYDFINQHCAMEYLYQEGIVS